MQVLLGSNFLLSKGRTQTSDTWAQIFENLLKTPVLTQNLGHSTNAQPFSVVDEVTESRSTGGPGTHNLVHY